MIIVSWNVRGLNARRKQEEISSVLSRFRVDVAVLLETRIRTARSIEVWQQSFSGWQFFHNYGHSDLGRIWLLARPGIFVTVSDRSSQHISFSVGGPSPFDGMAVYGSNNPSDRMVFYQSNTRVSSSPFLVLGDFNAVKCPSETSNRTGQTVSMSAFSAWCDALELNDHVTAGPLFTWHNNQPANPSARKLDRVMINDDWLVCYPRSTCIGHSLRGSDHSALLLSTDSQQKTLPKPFKYFAFWANHPSFDTILSDSWDAPAPGNVVTRFTTRLRKLKHALKTLNQEDYSNISHRVKIKEAELMRCKAATLSDPSLVNLEQERQISTEYEQLHRVEEIFYRQKSRVDWISKGDRNTQFFSSYTKARQARHTIQQLVEDDGTIISDIDSIAHKAVEFYSGLLGKVNPEVQHQDVHFYDTLVEQKLEDASSLAKLAAIPSAAEIADVFLHMPKNKAPGPDGFPADFYSRAWNVIEADVTEVVQNFFRNNSLPRCLNSTILSLLPKVPNADHMTKFRPISCCNTIYKGISKLLANKLSAVLPSLISPSQTAFIKGHFISDGVLLAHELVHGYTRTCISPRATLKIDLHKAFDSVDWDYLLSILAAMKFPPRVLTWIKVCLRTSMLSASINGGLSGYFNAKKGLRQGDPISPYLFVIAMEGLSCLLNKAVISKQFLLHPQCVQQQLSHLCFADDLLIFTKGNLEAMSSVCILLQQFYSISGLRFNPAKCEVFIAGCPDHVKRELADAVGFVNSSLPVRYLGIPLLTGKLTSQDCQTLVDKITTRITTWRAKKLTYGGKVELIRSVWQSMTSYWMNVFVLPQAVIKAIERKCSNCLWNLAEGGKAKIAWKTVALPKEEGGLGLTDLCTWNKASVIRHIWDLFSGRESLWVAWIRSYRLKASDFWSFSSTTGTWIWRKVLRQRQLIQPFINSGGDELKWNNLPMPKYSVRRVWLDIRQSRPTVPWSKLVRQQPVIPRNSFLAWTVVHNSLRTKDKLCAWGLRMETQCVLCVAGDESMNHLYCSCPYTKLVYEGVFRQFGQPIREFYWDAQVEAATVAFSSQSAPSLLGRLFWNAVVSSIWRTRCSALYAGVKQPASHVVEAILSDIYCLSATDVKVHKALQSVGYLD